MLTPDAIEAINFEQLATATDRLLLRGRPDKRRPSTNRIAYVDPEASEKTVFGRFDAKRPKAPSRDPWRTFTTTALVTSVFSVCAAIASLL